MSTLVQDGPGTAQRKVGCECDDGTVIVHFAYEVCEVCEHTEGEQPYLKCGTCGQVHKVGEYYNHNFMERRDAHQ